ncbi:hypothetical protein ACA29_07370 [Lederbergia galactosidilytica]|uniref:Uncharacterized protein n=1 Tax=Lederbergia galactosidilytica TaxID=217031 RepID=A0A0Q9YDJ1_9BACI|nr:hypothetical protein ACA29_07370 [Lederbergia galactosidilytica]
MRENRLAGKSLLLQALTAGITALGEQICGHPDCNFSIADYRELAQDLPIDISFAPTSISIGFEKLAHFSAVTKSKGIQHGSYKIKGNPTSRLNSPNLNSRSSEAK